jgi:hypothetical protein
MLRLKKLNWSESRLNKSKKKKKELRDVDSRRLKDFGLRKKKPSKRGSELSRRKKSKRRPNN